MLNVVNLSKKYDSKSPCVMLLGGFDGVHVGHKKLFDKAKTFSLPIAVMTIAGGKGTDLFSFAERRDIFSTLGADFVLELPFSDIREWKPKEFLDFISQTFSPSVFVCGDDFRFGFRAEGDVEILKALTHVRVEVEKLLCINGEKVGATAIKRYVEEGEVGKASALLCGGYFLKGTVVKDRGVGRTLSFPTANMLWGEKLQLKEGVYETSVHYEGKTYRAITNYGTRPTFSNDVKVAETHLNGFCGDLYGVELKVNFVRRLRDVQKFENKEALIAQLQEDIRRVREHD